MPPNVYAHDDRSQRRRALIEDDDEDENSQIRAQQIESQWAAEYQQAVGPDRSSFGRHRFSPAADPIESWKSDALKAIASYPELPQPLVRMEYLPILSQGEQDSFRRCISLTTMNLRLPLRIRNVFVCEIVPSSQSDIRYHVQWSSDSQSHQHSLS
jgi:hypothetical protein